MVFCNILITPLTVIAVSHNPYFNRWFSAIKNWSRCNEFQFYVTILILIDGFLQSDKRSGKMRELQGHNPYFNRWFSAICLNESLYEQLRESQSLF